MLARFVLVVGSTLGLLFAGQNSSAAEPAPPETIRVISYNIQFLPGFAGVVNKRKNPVYRAQAIGQKLVDYDLIGLNELFDQKPRELLLAEMRKIWGENLHVFYSPRIDPKRFSGGLAIISRYPIVEQNVLTYSKSSSPEKYGLGADGFATKGALHVRISLGKDSAGERLVDVFTTHMEAREDELRPSQYAELADFVHLHGSADRPTIMLGDFNMRGDAPDMQDASSPYNLMIGKYIAALPKSRFIDVWPALHNTPGGTSEQEGTDGGHRIDYIFVLDPQTAGGRLEPKQIEVNPFLDPKVTALSDHSAVQAVLEWVGPSK